MQQTLQVSNDFVKPSKSRLPEKRVLAAVAAALALHVWWLLSDRPPTQKEMTFAYRKHVVTHDNYLPLQNLMELRNHLNTLELLKQDCERLDEYKYRCSANVAMDGHPVESLPASGTATYTHDHKGWLFEPLETETVVQ